jgi:hypothetical protein
VGIRVRYNTRDDNFPSMMRELKAVDGVAIEVGVLNGESAWLASIHEYGCDIPVTDKMRKFLTSQGLYLKKETTHIHIPERSFLRTGYDKYRDNVMEKAKMLLQDVAAGRMDANLCVKALGIELSSKIKDYARDLNSPANHPFTADRKGSSNPLVDTGDMIGGITWRKAR